MYTDFSFDDSQFLVELLEFIWQSTRQYDNKQIHVVPSASKYEI